MYFDEKTGNWFSYKVADGSRVNLTASLPVKFFDESHDTPDAPPSLGIAGWTEGDKSVLLNDEFDIWEIRPDGTGARMVTNGEGRKQHLVFRTADRRGSRRRVRRRGRPRWRRRRREADPGDEAVDARDDQRRHARVGLLPHEPHGHGRAREDRDVDKSVGAPIKAKNADVVVFTEATFAEFPDLWVSDTNFSSPRR